MVSNAQGVSLPLGREERRRASDRRRTSKFARALLDSGADLVFGHSAHVFRGVDTYGGHPIVYGAGDFIDDYAVDEIERNDHSFIFIIQTEGRAIDRLELYPTVIRDYQARLAHGVEAEAIGDRMARLCDRLGWSARWMAPTAANDRRYLEIRVSAPRPASNRTA